MARVDPAVLDRMADAYQQGFSMIQIAAETASTQAWLSLDTVQDEDQWFIVYWPILEGAATATATLTRDYVQRQADYLGVSARLPLPDLSWLRADVDRWWYAPVARVGKTMALDPSISYDAAVRRAADAVSKLTTSLLRVAEQRALDQMMGSEALNRAYEWVDERPAAVPAISSQAQADAYYRSQTEFPLTQRFGSPKRWVRVPQAGACGWCRVVADQLYSDRAQENATAWHNFCRCTWRMVTPEEARTHSRSLGAGEWRDVIKERASVPPTGDIEGEVG